MIKFCSVIKLTAGHSKIENLEYRVTGSASDKTLSTKWYEGVNCGKGVNEVSIGGHSWGGRAKIVKSMEHCQLTINE